MSNRNGNEKLQDLFNKNIPVYSYSKLDSWSNCKFNWYNSYILHKRSKDNIYSLIGGVIHNSIEGIYQHKNDLVDAKEKFNKIVIESEKKGIKFPENPATTKINYIKNINHFFEHYKILNTKMITEQFVLLKIPKFENAIKDEDFIWIQMYIDSIIPVFNEEKKLESVIVNDWKTSSKFDKHKLLKASKQLIIYKLGVEQNTGVPVSKIGWTMLKYVYCCYRTKGSKKNPPQIKRIMQERKDSVKYFYKKIVQDLIDSGMDTIKAELLAGKSVNENSFDVLPQFVKDKYWIEDCFLEYEFNNEIIEECKQWVLNTVNEIESLDKELKNYPPVKIDEKNSYFCHNLCGRPDCIYLKKYIYKNSQKFKKEKKEEQITKEMGKIGKKINLDSLFK